LGIVIFKKKKWIKWWVSEDETSPIFDDLLFDSPVTVNFTEAGKRFIVIGQRG